MSSVDTQLSSKWLVMAGLVLPLLGQTPSEVNVLGVRYWTLNDSTRVAIELSAGFHYISSRIENPDRVFFDVAQSRPAIKGSSAGLHVVKVGDSRLRQVRIAQPEHGTTRIVLDLRDNVQFRASQLSGPDRLIVELFDPAQNVPEMAPSVTVSRRFPAKVADPGPAGSRSTVANFLQPEKTFTLAPPVQRAPRLHLLSEPVPQIASTMPQRVNVPAFPMRVSPPRTERAATVPARIARRPTSAQVTPANAIVTVSPAAQDRSGSRSLTRMLGLKLNRIIIDAGHGGKDVGTIGATGLYEKDVVLDLALRVGAMVEKKIGAQVVFTRSDDTFIELEDRPEIANQNHADLFISIHANASPAASVAGVETYVLSITPSNRSAEDLAARENSTSERSIADLQDFIRKIATQDKQKESAELAAQIHSSMVAGVHGNARNRNRGVRRAPFIVLIGAQMPAVLVEVGFLSNPGEEAKMRTPQHRQKVAESIFAGVRKYAESLSRSAPQLAEKNTISAVAGVSQ